MVNQLNYRQIVYNTTEVPFTHCHRHLAPLLKKKVPRNAEVHVTNPCIILIPSVTHQVIACVRYNFHLAETFIKISFNTDTALENNSGRKDNSEWYNFRAFLEQIFIKVWNEAYLPCCVITVILFFSNWWRNTKNLCCWDLSFHQYSSS